MHSVKERKARFVCCIALALNAYSVNTFFGYSDGDIGMEPRGLNGFGYDPVFYPEGYSNTFAEMSDQEKDSLSHRGRALQELRRSLAEN
jgi:XTP/dITP diphosphohydrolase